MSVLQVFYPAIFFIVVAVILAAYNIFLYNRFGRLSVAVSCFGIAATVVSVVFALTVNVGG